MIFTSKIIFRKNFFVSHLELIISDFLSHHPNFPDVRARRAHQMSESIPKKPASRLAPDQLHESGQRLTRLKNHC